MRLLISVFAVVWIALALTAGRPAIAQGSEQTPANDTDVAAENDSSADDADDAADASDDIFLPSEKIQADSEISFPSDI